MTESMAQQEYQALLDDYIRYCASLDPVYQQAYNSTGVGQIRNPMSQLLTARAIPIEELEEYGDQRKDSVMAKTLWAAMQPGSEMPPFHATRYWYSTVQPLIAAGIQFSFRLPNRNQFRLLMKALTANSQNHYHPTRDLSLADCRSYFEVSTPMLLYHWVIPLHGMLPENGEWEREYLGISIFVAPWQHWINPEAEFIIEKRIYEQLALLTRFLKLTVLAIKYMRENVQFVVDYLGLCHRIVLSARHRLKLGLVVQLTRMMRNTLIAFFDELVRLRWDYGMQEAVQWTFMIELAGDP